MQLGQTISVYMFFLASTFSRLASAYQELEMKIREKMAGLD